MNAERSPRLLLPSAEHPGIDQVAQAMFIRNAGEYADPAMLDLAWLDAEVRSFWNDQAQGVRCDLEQLARHGCVDVYRTI